MYILVQWIQDKKISILKQPQELASVDEGQEVNVRYGVKEYPATILKRSEDEDWLESLTVTVDGEILLKGKKLKNHVNIAKKKVITHEVSASRKRKYAIEAALSTKILKLKPAFNVQEESSRNDQISNEYTMDIDNEVAKRNSNVISELPSSDDTEKEDTCKICKLLPSVTIENVLFLEQMAIFARKKFEMNGGSTGSSSIYSPPKSSIEMKENCNENVELWPESGVFMNAFKLKALKRFKNNPKTLIRRLMLELVGEDSLKTMSALGQSNRTEIPLKIRVAVLRYVNKHTNLKVCDKEYIKILNYQCNTLRHPKLPLCTKENITQEGTQESKKESEATDKICKINMNRKGTTGEDSSAEKPRITNIQIIKNGTGCEETEKETQLLKFTRKLRKRPIL